MAETTPAPPVFAVRPETNQISLTRPRARRGAHARKEMSPPTHPTHPTLAVWRQTRRGRVPQIPHRASPDDPRHPLARPAQRRRRRRTLRGGRPDPRATPRRRGGAARTPRIHRAARRAARVRRPRRGARVPPRCTRAGHGDARDARRAGRPGREGIARRRVEFGHRRELATSRRAQSRDGTREVDGAAPGDVQRSQARRAVGRRRRLARRGPRRLRRRF